MSSNHSTFPKIPESYAKIIPHVMDRPFIEARAYLLGSVLGNKRFDEDQDSSLQPITTDRVFDEMFLKPLKNWKINTSLAADLFKKYSPLIQDVLDSKTLTPYQQVGVFQQLFKSFRDEVPKRHYKTDAKVFKAIRGNVIGKPYGTLHAVVRQAMENMLTDLSLRQQSPGAFFPDGRVWSKTCEKIAALLPDRQDNPGIKVSTSPLFATNRASTEESKELKKRVLAALDPADHLAMSGPMGSLIEPRVNTWLWHEMPGIGNTYGFVLKEFEESLKPTSIWNNPRPAVPITVVEEEDKKAKYYFSGMELIGRLSIDPKIKFLPTDFLLKYHLLTANEETFDRQFVCEALSGIVNHKSSAWQAIDAAAREELSRVARTQVELNPWSIIDLGKFVTPDLLKRAFELQPALIFVRAIHEKHPDWRDAFSLAYPHLTDKKLDNVIMMATVALGIDPTKDNAVFRKCISDAPNENKLPIVTEKDLDIGL